MTIHTRDRSGAAFPTMGRFIETDGTKLQEASIGGLTKREYIAALCLAQLCVRTENAANDAVAYADALLKALEES